MNKEKILSALLAVGFTVAISIALAAVSTGIYESYGMSIFVATPHLDWAVISERGEFLLNDLGDGKIELVGTTWFHTVMEPEPYWGWLSDIMIHSIHSRVLDHIKTVVEE